MAAGEEGQVGSWEPSQSTSVASVKMACQTSTATKSFTAAESVAHLLKTQSGSTLQSYTHLVMCSICQRMFLTKQQAKG